MHAVGAVDVLFQPAEGTCASPQAALGEMDAAGIELAFIAPCNRLTCERQWACVDTRLEDVAEYLRVSVRFAGLCGYNPFDLAESLREMEAARALGFRGTYVHLDSFGVPPDDRRFYPLYAKASELQQPVVVQFSIGESAERALRRVLRDFPELLLAAAHPRPIPKLFDLGADFERFACVLDTKGLAEVAGTCPAALQDSWIADRCMWGSNGASPTQTLADARTLALPQTVLAGILHNNALRYFASSTPDRVPRALDASVAAAER